MGSAKVSSAKPQLPMENKPAKAPFLSYLKKYFGQDKKKEKAKNKKEARTIEVKKETHSNENTVENILKSLRNLELNKKEEEKELKEDKPKERKASESEEDEAKQFTFKVIEEDRKRHSSEDSGFSEGKDDAKSESKDAQVFSKEDDVTESLNNLKIDEKQEEECKKDDKEKKKKVRIGRGPVKTKISDYKVEPYSGGQHDLDKFRQISQINKHALSGGQVIVNATPTPDYNEFAIALKQVEKISQTSTNQSEYWQDVLDLIREDSQKTEHFQDFFKEFLIPENSQKTEDYLKDFLRENSQKTEDFLKDFKEFVAKDESFVIANTVSLPVAAPNAIEEFSASQNLPNYEDSIDLNNSLLSFENVADYSTKMDYIMFPTPPRSENIPSPMSESQTSFYPSNWDNSLSPERERSSPVYNSDYEKYQEISHYEELSPVSEGKEEKKRERASSISSMTMKNFKDMQKEISNEFSKKDCCLINRKTCKELFDEHMTKLKTIERKNLCFKVAKMDLKTAYGVLHHILLSLCSGCEQEDLQCALFVLICQRVLAQSPALFVGDFGLSLLKSAVMRCPHKPTLTRFIVHYVYAALRLESTAGAQECVFPEVDAQGDNLIIACARGGDAYALVLAEITRSEARGDLPPLFRIHHANADGYTALHVACSQHSAASPRLHTQHVLLEHAQADVWKGDIKGGDTALHLAVNSVNCDLRVIMMLFKQLDRKLWKKLAHCQNMSSVTPLEYARSATKSTTRQNYPQEVLDFLKKCR